MYTKELEYFKKAKEREKKIKEQKELPIYKQILAIFITGWIAETKKLKDINHYLYEHTELFENGYESEFDELLHNFFAKKITRYTKELNELYLLVPDNIREVVQKNLRELEKKDKGL